MFVGGWELLVSFSEFNSETRKTKGRHKIGAWLAKKKEEDDEDEDEDEDEEVNASVLSIWQLIR
jgi:hypothetical protein